MPARAFPKGSTSDVRQFFEVPVVLSSLSADGVLTSEFSPSNLFKIWIINLVLFSLAFHLNIFVYVNALL